MRQRREEKRKRKEGGVDRDKKGRKKPFLLPLCRGWREGGGWGFLDFFPLLVSLVPKLGVTWKRREMKFRTLMQKGKSAVYGITKGEKRRMNDDVHPYFLLFLFSFFRHSGELCRRRRRHSNAFHFPHSFWRRRRGTKRSRVPTLLTRGPSGVRAEEE